MTPERWKQTEALYHEASRRPPGERAAFLADVCRDDEALRIEVESLLNEPVSAHGFVDGPALPAGAQRVADLAPAAMTGRTLGAYHLQTLLGAGGMGDVYRAHDSKLGRDVAIKILPRAFSSDPDRLARFRREARMLASINHPHICAIYGLEEADGIRFLILELVDGKTLADRLANAALGVSEALVLARQIAEALEIAHEKGIVHRDLKPANIKITTDGVVKVLDFGLAKAVGGDGSTPDLPHLPAVTRSGVREGVGVVLGTAAYMSPEQACGLPVDKRTDIWAFGCVLYEMLTRRVPFPAGTVSGTIGKILEREPDWSALPPATPVPVRRLLLRCLAKDPKQRWPTGGSQRLAHAAASRIRRSIPTRCAPRRRLSDPTGALPLTCRIDRITLASRQGRIRSAERVEAHLSAASLRHTFFQPEVRTTGVSMKGGRHVDRSPQKHHARFPTARISAI
jgi:serine/threonine protein kinase